MKATSRCILEDPREMAFAEARLPGQILNGNSAVQMGFDMRHKAFEHTLRQDRRSLGDHFTRMKLTLEHPRGQGGANAFDKARAWRKRSPACFPKRLGQRPKASVRRLSGLKSSTTTPCIGLARCSSTRRSPRRRSTTSAAFFHLRAYRHAGATKQYWCACSASVTILPERRRQVISPSAPSKVRKSCACRSICSGQHFGC